MARAALALLLAAIVLALAGAPHVHAGGLDRHECVACATAAAAAAPAQVVAVTLVPAHETAIELAPGHAPVTGAPLGAIPGQSPPSA